MYMHIMSGWVFMKSIKFLYRFLWKKRRHVREKVIHLAQRNNTRTWILRKEVFSSCLPLFVLQMLWKRKTPSVLRFHFLHSPKQIFLRVRRTIMSLHSSVADGTDEHVGVPRCMRLCCDELEPRVRRISHAEVLESREDETTALDTALLMLLVPCGILVPHRVPGVRNFPWYYSLKHWNTTARITIQYSFYLSIFCIQKMVWFHKNTEYFSLWIAFQIMSENHDYTRLWISLSSIHILCSNSIMKHEYTITP